VKCVSVSVPASTANLGPGFDCLGLALDLVNTITLQSGEGGAEVQVTGEGSGSLPSGEDNLCLQAARRVFAYAGQTLEGLSLRLNNQIPPGSGLGSSGTAILGGILAADALLRTGLSHEQILRLSLDFEKHADNLAASLLGGLVAVALENDSIITRKITIPDMSVVVVLPGLEISTSQMRKILPARVDLDDAVFNLSRAMLTMEAIRDQDFDLLSRTMRDRLHQPYRKAFIPGYEAAEEAALSAGASAVALSGAGPALIAFTAGNHREVSLAMQAAFTGSGLTARGFVLPVNQEGAQVIKIV
jgi:homoserine kinase